MTPKGGTVYYSHFVGYPKAVQNIIKREFPKFNPKRSKIVYGVFKDIAFIEIKGGISHTEVMPLEVWDISVGYLEYEDILFISDPINFRLSEPLSDVDFMEKHF